MKYIIALLFLAQSAIAASWYVKPGGAGNGTFGNEGSLNQAVVRAGWASAIAAGDTVYLRGGIYTSNGFWTINFSGSAGNLVTWRNYTNEYAKINGQWRFGAQTYHRFRGLINDKSPNGGLEFYDSLKGTHGGDPQLQFDDSAGTLGNEWINVVVHDVDNCWSGSTAGDQVRGVVTWYVGQTANEHCVYGGINVGSGNIHMFTSGFTYNSGQPGAVVKSNIMFGAGLTIGSGKWETILETTATSVIAYNRCYAADSWNDSGGGFRIGYSDGTLYEGLCFSNTVCGQTPFYLLGSFTSFTIFGNIALCSDSATVEMVNRVDFNTGTWTFNNNKYYSRAGALKYVDPTGSRTFAQWTANYPTFDTTSTSQNATLPADAVYVIPNQDEPYRANIAIYNWTAAGTVSVDVSSILTVGQRYRLYNAMNYLAGAWQTGVYQGGNITVTMTGLTVAPILYGSGMSTPSSPAPEFGAFVLQGAEATPTVSINGTVSVNGTVSIK